MLKRIFAFLTALTMIIPLGIWVYAGENTDGNATLNYGVTAVPVPDKVVIDGEFDEWDWSGRIQMYKDYEYKDIYYSEMAAMWDSEALYLGFKFTDDDPMICTYDPMIEPGWTWRGDAVQLRFETDRKRGWFTLAPYTPRDIGSLFIDYPNDGDQVGYATEPGGTLLNVITTESGAHKTMQLDAEIKYKKWEEGGGYNIEIKFPWDMLYMNPKVVAAGTVLKMGIECYWGDVTGTSNNEYFLYENAQAGKKPGGFRADATWGNLTLSPVGNLTPREYIHDKVNAENGTIHIQARVPKQAKKFSLRIEDNYGEIISQQIAEVSVSEDNIIGEDGDYYIVDTTWNGKDLMGNMVAPGEYTVTGIWHEGIVPYFDTTAYNPGNPPWTDSKGTGGWASDHVAQKSITSVGENVFIGSLYCESGNGIIKVDGNGSMQWSLKRSGEILASNDKYLYSLPGSDFYRNITTSGNTYLLRINQETGKFTPFVSSAGETRSLEYNLDEILDIQQGVMPEIGGMTANNDYVVMSVKSHNERIQAGFANFGEFILVIDAETGDVLKKIPLSNVETVAFADNGLLYAVVGDHISEINVTTGKIKELPIKEKSGESFGAIDVDRDGNILLYEGLDRQIKAYDLNGKIVYTIGKKGGRALEGKWDPDGLTHRVTAITVDSLNRVWVVENWNYPRRISCWDKNGLVDDFIGSPGYMAAGGALHDDDPERCWVGPNEMVLNREDMSYEMVAVNYVPDISKGQAFPLSATSNQKIQHFRADAGGVEREFIFDGSGDPTVLYTEVEEGKYQPCFAMGLVGGILLYDDYDIYVDEPESNLYMPKTGMRISDYLKDFAALPKSTQFIWNDYNYDGAISADECEFYNEDSKNSYSKTLHSLTESGWGNIMTSDMEFIVSGGGERGGTSDTRGFKISPAYFTEDGIPRYTKSSFQMLDTENSLFQFENVLLDDGKIVSIRTEGGIARQQYKNGIKAVDSETGKDLWWYPNLWPGVHGSQQAAVQVQGEVLGPIKLMGVVDSGSDTQTMIIRGNMGNDFLLTTDGYYVQTLFRDGRIPQLKFPDNKLDARDLDMSKFTENGEPFSGTAVRHSDGKVRILVSTAGAVLIIVRVEGLDSIKYLDPFKITVTKAMIDEADAYNKADHTEAVVIGGESETDDSITITKAPEGIVIDGDMIDWSGNKDVTVYKDGVEEEAYVSLCYDDKYLYAAFNVVDKTPMKNTGEDSVRLFKTGDACDINLSPSRNSGAAVDGDLRVVMSVMDGEGVAVLMKQVSSAIKKPQSYTSPVMTLPFDYVAIMEDAEVAIGKDEQNGSYVLEAKLPLSSLGLNIKAGDSITGDVGIIVSDESGTYNKARVYYYNKHTGLVSDMPSEARLYPEEWGKVTFGE